MDRRSGSRARIVLGTLLLSGPLAIVAFACSSELGSGIADGNDASNDAVDHDSARSLTQADSSDAPGTSLDGGKGGDDGGEDGGSEADADALAPSRGPAGQGLVACGPETCTAVTEECTRVLTYGVPPGFEDAAVSDAAVAPCQPYPTNSSISVTCDDPTDCLPGECLVIGKGYTFPGWADAGFSELQSLCRSDDPDSVTFATDAAAASFHLRTCGDAAPCPLGQSCHRQTCQGFAFDLCGDIPPGACAR